MKIHEVPLWKLERRRRRIKAQKKALDAEDRRIQSELNRRRR